uniref:A kinase-anchoring proteins AKAP-5 and AKAP-12 calmodulin (CaM)-binding domain-containing protein n=1 Tax=Electrophorus electricus TaxID=8005 RepID=A0A4W4DRD9_ELEEL
NQSEELNGHCEDRVIGDVGSGIVTLKEDGVEIEDLQGYVSETNADNVGKETVNADGMTMKEGTEADSKLNDIEVGFKKIFRFVGFKFTLKKDKCDTTASEERVTNKQYAKITSPSKDSNDTTEESSVCIRERDAEEMQKESINGKISVESKNSDLSPKTDSEMPGGQISEITDYNEQVIPDKELVKEVPASLEPEEPTSQIKRFFTQGIWLSVRKRRKGEEASKENRHEEIKITDKEEGETFDRAAQEDSTCVCLDVFNFTFEESKDLQAGERHEGMSVVDEALMNPHEQEKVQDSPFRRIFRSFSRRQKETKPVEPNLINSREYLNESLLSSTELMKVQKQEKEAKVEQPMPTEEEQVTDAKFEESKKKLDSAVSWETLICGGSIKKRSRKTFHFDDETQDKGDELKNTTESLFGSSIEGDFDHLSSSNEHTESPAEGEGGSTWKSLKKLVTPKRKVRTEESGSPEQIPSDSEFSKDESSCSIKNLISRRKKRTSNGWQEHSSSDETGKGIATDTEDDDTPVVVPLSEYEIMEPENLKEITESTGKFTIKKEMYPMTEEDNSNGKNLSLTLSYAGGPSFIPNPPNYVEDLTEFISKHQQLSDIPEEGIIEESVQTPVSSTEWTTQDDTLAEDIIELTADAVTAPEPTTDHFNEDENTEMVSAVSHLTESPKTSRNITPAPSQYDMTDADVVLQEVVETICRTPSVLSFKTTDRNPETLLVSVSPCVVESTVSHKTNVLVAPEKTEVTPMCIGLVSQDIDAVEEFLSLPLVEGIHETNEAVPTELVCIDLPEESKAVGIATNEVCEFVVSELESEFHEAVSDDNTHFVETEKKAEIPIIMHTDLLKESRKDEILNVVQVEEYPIEVLYRSEEHMPVAFKGALQGECQPTEKKVITKNINRPENEGPLDTAIKEAVCEQQAHYEEICAEVTQAEIDEFETVTHDVIVPGQDTNIHEIREEMSDVLASAVVCPETISIVRTISNSVKLDAEELKNYAQMGNVPSLHFMKYHDIQAEVMNTELKTAMANVERELEFTAAVVVAGIYDKVAAITKGATGQHKIEPISAEESGEIVTRNVFHSNKAENISGNLNELPCEEKDLSAKEASLLETVTNDEGRAAEKLEDISKVSIDLDKYINTEITPVQDLKTKQCIGEKEEVSRKEPVICEQPSLQIEFAQKGRQSLANTTVVSQPKSQKDSELSADTHIKEAAPESVEEESPMTRQVKRACVDAASMISDTHLNNVPETNERTAKPETDFEITTKTGTPYTKIEPQRGIEQLQKEIESENESSEDKKVMENYLKVTETISEISIIYVGEANSSKVVSTTDKESNDIENTCELQNYTVAKPGVESEISEEPVESIQSSEETFCGGRAIGTSSEPVSMKKSDKTTEVQLIVKHEQEALFKPELTELCEPVATEVCELVSKHKSQIIECSQKYTNFPYVTEYEVGTELKVAKTAASALAIETLAMMEIKEELTIISTQEDTAESAEQVTEPMFIKNKIKTVTQPQAEKQVKSHLEVERPEVTESKIETPVVTEVKVEVITDVQTETRVLTSVPRIFDTIPTAEMSVIKDTKVQSHFLTLIKEPEIAAGITAVETLALRETQAVRQDSQRATRAAVVQLPAFLPVSKEAEVLAEASKKKGRTSQDTSGR